MRVHDVVWQQPRAWWRRHRVFALWVSEHGMLEVEERFWLRRNAERWFNSFHDVGEVD